MATAAPHVKLLRQLAGAKDDYLRRRVRHFLGRRQGDALPGLRTAEPRRLRKRVKTDQRGTAIDALLAALPRVFTVSDWRRAMSPHETLSITINELAGPFVRLAGSYADEAPTAQSQFEGFPCQQNPSQPQPQQSQPQSAAFSSAPSQYSSYYTADQQRNAYQNYYGHQYNQQQGAQAQQDRHLHPNSARIADTTFPSLTALVHFHRALHSNLSLGTQQPSKLEQAGIQHRTLRVRISSLV